MDEKEVRRLLRSKERALKENLLESEDARKIQAKLWEFLDHTLSPGSIGELRYRKLKKNPKFKSWWSNADGYFSGNPWEDMIEPFVKIFEQYLSEKTIKRRFSDAEYFVESRSQGEDIHLFVGKRDGTDKKAHIVIDGVTGEIRVDPKDQPPEEVLSDIETILTLASGKRIRCTRDVLEELEEEEGGGGRR